jgi:hypothetical protein
MKPPPKPRAQSSSPSLAAARRLGRELKKRRPAKAPTKVTSRSKKATTTGVSAAKQLLVRRRMATQAAAKTGAAGVSAGKDASNEESFKQGLDLLNDQHYGRALVIFRELCAANDKDDIYRMYALWAEYRSAPEPPTSVAAELRTILIDHLEDDYKGFAYYALGHLALIDGKEESAERYFRKAFDVDRRNKDAERYMRILGRRIAAAKAAK